jgi:hypothetical protein
MRTAVLLAVLLAGMLPAAQMDKPPVSRAALAPIEKRIDARLGRPAQEEPYDLLGNTRAVYLEGFGVVFTTEVGLLLIPPITPFNPDFSKEEIQTIHQRKAAKLPLLKQAMREMLAAAAASLPALPADEQIAVSVTLFYFKWEDRSGLPSQILMQATKKSLAGKPVNDALTASIRLQEF